MIKKCTLHTKGSNYDEIEAGKPITPNNGVANINKGLVLVNRPFYSDAANVEYITINGNGYSVTQEVTDPKVLGWNAQGNIANMGRVFSSSNASSLCK